MNILNHKICVIKIGSALVVNNDGGLNQHWLEALVEDVIMLRLTGLQVILVSSGAIASGKLKLGLTKNNAAISLEIKQAASAIGQVQLLQMYQSIFDNHGILGAQLLLTADDCEYENRFIQLKSTLNTLLSIGIIPIINENDSVATKQNKYGNNDQLSARIAELIQADVLFLLSDIDGLYSDDPKINPEAEFIPIVDSLSPEILSMGKGTTTPHGTGGMKTKIQAAKIAMESGCHLLIIRGNHLRPIKHYLDTKKGTWFIGQKRPECFDLTRDAQQTILQKNEVCYDN